MVEDFTAAHDLALTIKTKEKCVDVTCRPEGRGALEREWQPGAVRKLFDKEIDNHHEELLLAAQLASWQLRSLCSSLQGPALAAFSAALTAWLLQVLQVKPLSVPTLLLLLGRGIVPYLKYMVSSTFSFFDVPCPE